MARCRQVTGTLIAVVLGLGACAELPTAPAPDPAFDVVAGNPNGALIDVGEWSVPPAVLRDPDNQLALYVRFNNGFCNAAGSQFVRAVWRDVIRLDESWRTVETADGVWVYAYHWTGQPINCAWLVNNTPLATGRATRRMMDNDFYPFAPYGPGPGMNSYRLSFHGALTTADDASVQLLGLVHGLADRDGTIVKWDTKVQLSPDPRN